MGRITLTQCERTLRMCFHYATAIVKAMSEYADFLFTNFSDVVTKIEFVMSIHTSLLLRFSLMFAVKFLKM